VSPTQTPTHTPRLILASASPRRQQLLRDAGYDFVVHPADIDEDDHPPRILPADLAEYLAAQKAKAVAAEERFRHDVILAADTVVAFGDRPLDKPADAGRDIAIPVITMWVEGRGVRDPGQGPVRHPRGRLSHEYRGLARPRDAAPAGRRGDRAARAVKGPITRAKGSGRRGV